ncbi:hypothetical protein Bca4012_026842 [Brassica carinata]
MRFWTHTNMPVNLNQNKLGLRFEQCLSQVVMIKKVIRRNWEHRKTGNEKGENLDEQLEKKMIAVEHIVLRAL